MDYLIISKKIFCKLSQVFCQGSEGTVSLALFVAAPQTLDIPFFSRDVHKRYESTYAKF